MQNRIGFAPVRFFALELNLTAAPRRLSSTDSNDIMADTPPPNNPLPGTPAGAEPLKKSTGKVQPKKETVRINLPPKPTAAPTIKLPTLPPGGPTGAPSPAPAAPVPPASPAPALKTAAAAAAPKTAAAPTAAAAPTTAQKPAAPRPAVAPATPSIKTLDKVLIFTAAFASLVAVGMVTWVFLNLQKIVQDFSS
jgi:hypothetical protein